MRIYTIRYFHPLFNYTIVENQYLKLLPFIIDVLKLKMRRIKIKVGTL